MYLVPLVQLSFLVILSFAISRLIKLKKKVNQSSKSSTGGSTFFERYFHADTVLNFFRPSFVGSYGVWFPQFLHLRNCISFVWNGGRVLITFDPTTAMLDLLTIGATVATKSVKDDTNKEALLIDVFFNHLKSASQFCINSIKNLITYNPNEASAPVMKKDKKTVTSSASNKLSPVPKVAEAVLKESKEVAEDAKKVVVKVVVAAEESKTNVYRFRVAKEFSFSELKKAVEERWVSAKSSINAVVEPKQLKLKYQDDEHEWITVQNQLEWEEAMRVGKDLVRIHVA